MTFYVGLDDVYNACHFDRCFISVNRLVRRKGDFVVNDWIMDSGAFSQIKDHGRFLMTAQAYARQINRWRSCGNLLAAVAQDWMCEPFILERTGLTVHEHQMRTIANYVELKPLTSVYVMPVLQGYRVEDYLRHIELYGELLTYGMWVGVGSVCKRNGDMGQVERILTAINRERPDLKLHGFGLKLTALRSSIVNGLLHSADSMAWSYSARKQGRSCHDWNEAAAFVNKIATQPREHRQEWLICV